MIGIRARLYIDGFHTVCHSMPDDGCYACTVWLAAMYSLLQLNSMPAGSPLSTNLKSFSSLGAVSLQQGMLGCQNRLRL